MLTATEISILLMIIEKYSHINIDTEWNNTIKEIKRKLETMQIASSEG
jgi:hypothetical protein|tara:strand:+ start:754 stop:897 length:144 start_codon:yes stop_codon:yes gene_type:complete